MNDELIQSPDDGKFSKVAFSWLCGSFVWLAVSGVLGILESLGSVISLGGVYDSALNAGLLMLARSGVFIYGWAGMATVALLLYCIRLHANHWNSLMRTFAWCWSAGVTAGVFSVLAGWGSGVAAMPFAHWVFVPLAAIAWGIHFIVWTDIGERGWRVRVPALVSFFIICVALALIGFGKWKGMGGAIMMACIHFALMGAVVTIALTGLWRSVLAAPRYMTLPVSVILTLLPLMSCFAGIRNLDGLPVSWLWMMVGTWSARGIAGVLGVIGFLGLYRLFFRGSLISSTVRFWMGASLAMMILWGGVEFFFPGGRVFEPGSAGEWYIVELLLFCSLGLLLRTAWHLCLHGKVSWGDYSWGAGCLFLWITWALYGYTTQFSHGINPQFIGQALCEGVAFASIFAIIAWIFLFLSALISWISCIRGEAGELVDQSSGGEKKYFSKRRGCVGLLLLILAFSSLIRTVSDADAVTFVKRPGTSLKGSLIYAREGCGVCHTQMIRRSPLRLDLQREIDDSGISGGAIRETEPEDYSPLMQEGAAHMGWVALGPDLTHLKTRLNKRLSYEDSSGNSHMIARPEEWVLLHMYNPREAQLKKTWSFCPSLPHLFEQRLISRGGRADNALPVKTPLGYEVVPTDEGKALLTYLMTLERVSVSNADGTSITSEALEKRTWREPGVNVPSPDLSKAEVARKKREFARGQEIYLAKCSVCHGIDGKGDSINYPPLKDSEWITEKEGSILADIIKNGLNGPIQVKGREWNSIMLPPGVGSLDDLIPLMNYLRSSMSSKSLSPVLREDASKWWSAPPKN